MTGIIVVGSKTARLQYIDQYISDQQIRDYNIVRFSEPLKIAQVRELIKSIHTSLSAGSPKLFIISAKVSIPAQNALLKTLEELPENVSIVFEVDSKDQLLPTIQSRCSLKILPSDKNKITDRSDDRFYAEVIEQLCAGSSLETALRVSEILSTNDKNWLKTFIFCLHSDLTSSKQRLLDFYKKALLLKILNQQYQYISQNNVNERFMLESAFLDLIE